MRVSLAHQTVLSGETYIIKYNTVSQGGQDLCSEGIILLKLCVNNC